jgi:hypothetical protein
MNQDIKTLIYPVKDARRSFSSSWESILMSNNLTTSPSGSETRKLV